MEGTFPQTEALPGLRLHSQCKWSETSGWCTRVLAGLRVGSASHSPPSVLLRSLLAWSVLALQSSAVIFKPGSCVDLCVRSSKGLLSSHLAHLTFAQFYLHMRSGLLPGCKRFRISTVCSNLHIHSCSVLCRGGKSIPNSYPNQSVDT